KGAALTNVTDAQPKFNMDYFVGVWNFEVNLSESPLGAGGPMSGSETVRNVWDGRFWDITIKGEGPEGAFTGKGIITYQDSFSGQSYMRYEVTRGVALLRTGNLGCDLCGPASRDLEIPVSEHHGAWVHRGGGLNLDSSSCIL